MVKRYALMESLSTNLHDFLKKVGENLPLPDKKFLRDLWRQKNIGTYGDGFEAVVRPHGVILIKITPAGK